MSSLQIRIKEKIEEISKTANEYPGAVIIHNIQEIRIVYMSPRSLKKINRTWDEMKNMSIDEYHEAYFNPDDANEYLPKI